MNLPVFRNLVPLYSHSLIIDSRVKWHVIVATIDVADYSAGWIWIMTTLLSILTELKSAIDIRIDNRITGVVLPWMPSLLLAMMYVFSPLHSLSAQLCVMGNYKLHVTNTCFCHSYGAW